MRELRQHASRYLKLVEGGRTIEVTARGRSVALLVPARPVGRRDRLVAQGRLVQGAGDLLDLGPPLPASKGALAPSDRLRRARARER